MDLGLALSGGAVRGMAHIGVIKYLEEINVDPDIISGTSAGSIVGALFAAGFNSKQLEEIAYDIKWSKILRAIIPPRWPRMGLIDINFLHNILETYLKGKSFSELKKPFIAIAVDLQQSKPVFIKKGDLLSAILASCAIPGIFTPVERKGLFLVDGGLCHSVPTKPLLDKKVKQLIAVNVNAYHNPSDKPQSIFEIIYRSIHLMNHQLDILDQNKADYSIVPNLSEIGMWDLNQTQRLIELGYQEAKQELDQFSKKAN